jgi:hypothetical protein
VATSSGGVDVDAEAMLESWRQEPGLTQHTLVVGQLQGLTGYANFGCHRHLVVGSVRPGMNRRAAPLGNGECWKATQRRRGITRIDSGRENLGDRYSVELPMGRVREECLLLLEIWYGGSWKH